MHSRNPKELVNGIKDKLRTNVGMDFYSHAQQVPDAVTVGHLAFIYSGMDLSLFATQLKREFQKHFPFDTVPYFVFDSQNLFHFFSKAGNEFLK